MQFLQIKEYEKMRQRLERSERKGQLLPKEHKFWNTQVITDTWKYFLLINIAHLSAGFIPLNMIAGSKNN